VGTIREGRILEPQYHFLDPSVTVLQGIQLAVVDSQHDLTADQFFLSFAVYRRAKSVMAITFVMPIPARSDRCHLR
jgi:hypothetical protein